MISNSFACLLAGSSLLAASQCLAQTLPPPPATYAYAAYTVLDRTAPGPDSLTAVANVGGSLRLNADGTYHKSLSIVFPAGPRYFAQTGRVSFPAPDSIVFAFSDLKGPDVQRGTYHYAPATHRLTINLAGYPPGNEGRYELFEVQHGEHAPQYTEGPDDAQQQGCGDVLREYQRQHPPKKPLRPTKPRPRR